MPLAPQVDAEFVEQMSTLFDQMDINKDGVRPVLLPPLALFWAAGCD